jgi:hypothetical protein
VAGQFGGPRIAGDFHVSLHAMPAVTMVVDRQAVAIARSAAAWASASIVVYVIAAVEHVLAVTGHHFLAHHFGNVRSIELDRRLVRRRMRWLGACLLRRRG